MLTAIMTPQTEFLHEKELLELAQREPGIAAQLHTLAREIEQITGLHQGQPIAGHQRQRGGALRRPEG